MGRSGKNLNNQVDRKDIRESRETKALVYYLCWGGRLVPSYFINTFWFKMLASFGRNVVSQNIPCEYQLVTK